MAASKVEVCNLALSMCNAPPITSFTEGPGSGAEHCRTWFDHCLKECLALIPWTFAEERTTLKRETTAPAWKYSYQYVLPSDFVGHLRVQDDPEWIVERGRVLTDAESPLYVVYTRFEENTVLWTPMFDMLMAARLAAAIAPAVTGEGARVREIYEVFEYYKGPAMAEDAKEGNPAQDQTNRYVDARDD